LAESFIFSDIHATVLIFMAKFPPLPRQETKCSTWSYI